MNLIRTSCIRIPESYQSEQWCQEIIRDLTRIGSSYEDPTIKVTSVYYEKRDGYIMIPRFYDVYKYAHKVMDYVPDGLDININFNKQWRNDLQRLGFQFFIDNDRGILKLPPGEGKTVITIGAICKIKKKTIIFVHKDSLVTQWKDRFLEHSDIKIDDIGLLDTAKCESVLQKPIVISTVQTMNSMIDRLPDIEKILLDAKFGMAVWDECHTTSGAEKYSRSSLFLPCKRVYGLSATPGRADQNHDIIWKHVGEVYAPDGETNTLAPKIIMVYFDHKVMSCHQKYVMWGFPDKNGKFKLKYPRFDVPRYLQMLTAKNNDKYIPYLRKILRRAYDVNRNVLLISDRIKVLDKVAGCIPLKSDIGFFIPRSGNARDSDLLKRVVLSTPGSSRDGTDKPSFDCLIMANPLSNIEQAIGRVCRYMPNKPQPIVFDIVDCGSEDMMNRAKYRLNYYQEKKWDVVEKKF